MLNTLTNKKQTVKKLVAEIAAGGNFLKENFRQPSSQSPPLIIPNIS